MSNDNTHYNNIFNKKNIEYSLEEKSSKLPYDLDSKGDVELKTDQILFNPVNNVFQKLVDNDLYNEALLKQYTEEGGDNVGPSFVSSEVDVLNSADANKKFILSTEDGIAIVHKERKTPEESLSGRFLDGIRVNKTTFIDDSYFAATDSGLFASENRVNWKNVLSTKNVEFLDICYNYSYSLNGSSLLSSFDWIGIGKENNNVRFFAHDGNSNSWKYFASDATLSSFDFSNLEPTHVYSFEGDNKIYFGTKNSGLYGFYGYLNEKPEKEIGTDNWTINDFVEIERKDPLEKYLLATNYGIKQSKKTKGFGNLKEFLSLDRRTFPYDVLNISEKTYVGTSKGLAIIDLNGNVNWVENLQLPCYSIAYFNGNVYVGTSNGIFKVDHYSAEHLTENEIVFKLISNDGKLFAYTEKNETKAIVFYDTSDLSRRNTIPSFGDNKIEIRQLVSKNNCLYIVTNQGIFSIAGGSYKKKFLERNVALNGKKIVFSKNLSKNEVFVQIEDGSNFSAYVIDNIDDPLDSEIQDCPNEKLLDVSKTSNGDWLFLTENNKLYINGIDSGISALKASEIKIVSYDSILSGIAYVSLNGDVRLSNDSGISRIDSSGNFIDFIQSNLKLYALKNDSIVPFRSAECYSLSVTPSTLNVEDTVRSKIFKYLLDGTDLALSVNTLDVKASKTSLSVGNKIQDNLTNLSAIDYVGYATDALQDNNFVLAAENGSIKTYIEKENGFELRPETENKNIKCFADSYGFDENGTLFSGTIFALGTDKNVYRKDATVAFIENSDADTENLKDCVVVGNRMFVLNNRNEVYVRNDTLCADNTLLVSSDTNINKLVKVGNDIVLCKDGSIEAYNISALDDNTEYYNQPSLLEDLNLSVCDFAEFPINVEQVSADSISNLFSGKQALTLTGDLTKLSDIAFVYKDNNDIVVEDFSGNGYRISVIDNAISSKSINDYTTVYSDLTKISNIISLTNGIDLSYDIQQSLEKTVFEGTTTLLTNLNSSNASSFNLTANEAKTVQLQTINLQVPNELSDKIVFLLGSQITTELTSSNPDVSTELSILLDYVNGYTGNLESIVQSIPILSRFENEFPKTNRLSTTSQINLSLIASISNSTNTDTTVSFNSVIQGEISCSDALNAKSPLLRQESDRMYEINVSYYDANTSADQFIDGFYFELPSEKYLGYDFEKGFFTFDDFAIASTEKRCGAVYLKETDFSIDGVPYKNQSFNDFFCYLLDDSDNSIFVPQYSHSSSKQLTSKEYLNFLKSNAHGKVSSIKTYSDKLFVGFDDSQSSNNVFYASKNAFPNFISVDDATGSIESLNIDSEYLYAKHVYPNNSSYNYDVYVVSSNSNVETAEKISTITFSNSIEKNNVFESNGSVYVVGTYGNEGLGVFSLNGSSHPQKETSINVYDNYIGYLPYDTFWCSPDIIAKNGIRYSKLAYDLASSFSIDSSFNGIKDIKTLTLDGNRFLLFANSTSISSKNLQNNETTILASGFSDIATFGYDSNGMLVVLDGTTLYTSKELLSLDGTNLTQIDFSKFFKKENVVNSGILLRFTQINNLESNEQEIGISDTDHYLLYFTRKIAESTPIYTTNEENLCRFVKDDSNDPLFVLGNLSTICQIDNYSKCTNLNNSIRFTANAFVVENDDSFWTIGRSNTQNYARNIKRGDTKETFFVESRPNGVFKLNDEIFYYSTSEKEVFASENVYDYSDNALSSGVYCSENRDVYALKFFGNNKYVYNYVNSAILCAGYAYNVGYRFQEEGLRLETSNIPISSKVRISSFETNDSTLMSSVNNQYITTEQMTTIEQFGDQLFFSNGADGYVYNLDSNVGEKIVIDQLKNMNVRQSVLMFSKNTNKNFVGYGNIIATFDDFSNIRHFGIPVDDLVILANSFRSGINDIEVVEKDLDFLIGSASGAKYVYDKTITRSYLDKENPEKSLRKNVATIDKINVGESENHYLVSQENCLYEISDLKKPTFKQVLKLQDDDEILNVFVVQQNEYLVATTKGLYTTSNVFKAENDLDKFTIKRVYEIINEELVKVIKHHVETEHLANSFITEVNKKADNKMSFVSKENICKDKYDYSAVNGTRVVENDIIDTIEIVDRDYSGDTYVKVAFKNWATTTIETEAFYSSDGFVSKFIDPTSNKAFDISTVPYIVKNWKSGLKEIYIYVPSTATYYINNPSGISNSLYTYNSISRENVPGASNVNSLPESCTQLRVYLYNSHFRIKTILAAQCVGNSLPLKIYKDNVNADDSWKGFFDTVVQPSVLRSLPKTTSTSVNNVGVCTDDLDRIFLDFSIYGTDAQAIRIIAES